MSQAAMEALIDIAYWYASPLGTFIRMYNVEKALHVSPVFHGQARHVRGVISHLDRVVSEIA